MTTSAKNDTLYELSYNLSNGKYTAHTKGEKALIDRAKLEKILPLVEKPARYTGGELNMVKKNPEGLIRFALAFPDVYEVGMSHLGTSILYHLLNERQDTYVERAFAPWADMQEKMQQSDIQLYTLETGTELLQMDMIGFNLSYEMCYTTVLKMLLLSKIPIWADQREEKMPLIIAGGACTYNPEPLAAFMDLFVIGEGEEVTGELLDLLKRKKQLHWDKKRFLQEASRIEGVYVPYLYEVTYREDGTVKDIVAQKSAPLPIYKRFVKDMDRAYFPMRPIVPFVNTIHDRANLEVFRGCSRGCRFCQAGFIYRPVREKKTKTLLREAKEIIQNTGYEEISLTSLSTSDYSDIENLATALLDELGAQRVSVSLPSLRVDTFDKEYAKKMQDLRKSSFTFAPEAGTQRLRDVINKNVTHEDIMRAATYAFESGCTTMKLYFMLGLPTETKEDIEGIAHLAQEIVSIFRNLPKEKRRGFLKLTVSTSCFVPKPFTPFVWCGQESIEKLQEKQRYLKSLLSGIKGVRYIYHDPYLSYLEAIFAKGDRKLAPVLAYAVEHGAMFDSWQEFFDFALYEEAFAQAGIEPSFYANREIPLEETLPFDHISCYVSKVYLQREYQRAVEAQTTHDCRDGCTGCGLMPVGGCAK